MSAQEPIIGIDLGTSTTCVSIVRDGTPEILLDSKGRSLIPSVVAFTPGGEVVGADAREFLLTDPENTVYSFKRVLGGRVDDPAIRTALSGFPYRLAEGPNKSVVIQARGQTYSIPEIAAKVLAQARAVAESALGVPVKKAVCAVPSTFNDAQRASTRIAGRIAGLDFVHLINEPTAAALAFGYDRDETSVVCVYDFGGGTFDFTILEMDGGLFRVVAADGDPFLGGDDLDRVVASTAAEMFRRQTGRQLWNEVAEWQRLLFAAEAAKCRLGTHLKTTIRVPGIIQTQEGPKDLILPLSRKMFGQICRDHIRRSLELCQQVVGQSQLKARDIDAVMLVGGTTLATNVRMAVARFFGKAPDVSVMPTHAVAFGAAIHGAVMSGQELAAAGPRRLLEMSTTALAVSIGGSSRVIIDANEMLPVSETVTFSTNTDGQTAITLSIFQGRGKRPEDWGYLSDVAIDGLPQAPAGKVSVSVTFTINEQNRVSVTAHDGRGQTINCRLGADERKRGQRPELDQALQAYLAESRK